MPKREGAPAPRPPKPPKPPKPPATDTSVGGNTSAGVAVGPPTLADIAKKDRIGGANNPSKTNAQGNAVPKATSSAGYKKNFRNEQDYTKGGSLKSPDKVGFGGGGRGTTSGGGGGGGKTTGGKPRPTGGGGGSTGGLPTRTNPRGERSTGGLPGRPPGASGYNLNYGGNGFGTRGEGEVPLNFGSGAEGGGGGGGGAAGANPISGGTSLQGLSVDDVTKFGAKETKKQRLKSKGVVKTRAY